MRPGGRIVLVGYLGGREARFDLTRVIGRDVRLLPANQLVHQQAMFDEGRPCSSGSPAASSTCGRRRSRWTGSRTRSRPCARPAAGEWR